MILLIVVVSTASAYVFSAVQERQYEATADLIYERPLDVSNPLTMTSTDPNERSLELRSVASVLASPDMDLRASTLLHDRRQSSERDYELTAEPITEEGRAAANASSNIVRITVTSNDSEFTAAVANAYADAFVAWRKERIQDQIENAAAAIKARMASYKGDAKKSADYLVLQQRLEDLRILAATATGNFRVLVPAAVPADPVAPKPVRNGMLGLGLGVLVGVALAFLLEQFDTRIRTHDEIAAILRQPIVARVPNIGHKTSDEGMLIAMLEPDGVAAEAFRIMRTNLDFMAINQEVRSIGITSCVQGEGKSATLANLAVSLALAGKKVVVVDADLRRPRQHTYFGLRNTRGLSTVAAGQLDLKSALQPVDLSRPTAEGSMWSGAAASRIILQVLTSGPIPPNPGEIIASRNLEAVIDALEGYADVVLVDTPAMLAVGDTSALAPRLDGLLFLVDLHVVRRPQVIAVTEQLDRLPVHKLGVIVRHHDEFGSGYRYAPYRHDTQTVSKAAAPRRSSPSGVEQRTAADS